MKCKVCGSENVIEITKKRLGVLFKTPCVYEGKQLYCENCGSFMYSKEVDDYNKAALRRAYEDNRI